MTHPGERVILSASRRTDLPGWHARRLAERLSNTLDTLGRDGIYGVVFWTRFPAALLDEPLRGLIERDLPATVVNLTLTGLGGTRLEPGGPPTDDVLAVLPELVELIGGPDRLRWRFDPLIYGRSTHRGFAYLAERFAALRVPTCTFSFPSARSLRGDMFARYERLGVPRWPDVASRRGFVTGMARIAGPLGIQLLCCSQPGVLPFDPSVRPAQCIPLDVLAAAHPAETVGPTGKDQSQRRHCTCPPSIDLGNYRTDRCRSGCLYCYSVAGGPDESMTLPLFERE